jgi:VWFA-related protein
MAVGLKQIRMSFVAAVLAACLLASARGQEPAPAPKPAPAPVEPAATDAGPQTDNGGIVLPKKKQQDTPPPAPAQEKVKNPDGAIFSMRVDVPLVNLDVSVLLDSTHEFVPGLKQGNFLVVEDGVEQQVQSVRVTKRPITAVLLLEFAANSYAFIQDMQNASSSFFRSLQPDDYVAVETYDIRPRILTDFTNNRDTIRQALESLTIPMMRDSNEFDALYGTLDRLSRVDGRKYVILISSGVDTFSKINLDQMLAKIKATPDVTIFTVSTGNFARTMAEGRGMSGSRNIGYLQADNEMNTFAQMTGGKHFKPTFQGEMPDIFAQINDAIRNQYVLTYRPTNTSNDGGYRKVKVYLVDNEGLPMKMRDEKGRPLKYSVIARDGYRAKRAVE